MFWAGESGKKAGGGDAGKQRSQGVLIPPQLPPFGQKPREGRSVKQWLWGGEPEGRGASAPRADQKSGEGLSLALATGAWPSKVNLVLCDQARGPNI